MFSISSNCLITIQLKSETPLSSCVRGSKGFWKLEVWMKVLDINLISGSTSTFKFKAMRNTRAGQSVQKSHQRTLKWTILTTGRCWLRKQIKHETYACWTHFKVKANEGRTGKVIQKNSIHWKKMYWSTRKKIPQNFSFSHKMWEQLVPMKQDIALRIMFS